VNNSKINGLLQKLVERTTADNPDRLLDIVVTPSAGSHLDALLAHIENFGGQMTSSDEQAIHARVPAKHISALADSALISTVRPERVYRMQ
jgi:hypothetical protein